MVELEQLLATGSATWRLRVTAARHGGAGKNQHGSGEKRAGELEGQVVGLERRGAAVKAGARRRGATVGGAEQQRNREGGERGRRRGLVCNFLKVQGVHCEVRFSFKP
jgi:hypothetical protein